MKCNIFIRALLPVCIFLGVLVQSKNLQAINTGDLLTGKKFPVADLRGYGNVSGEVWSSAQGGNLLIVECEDGEKAKLMQAKYLSDLQVLPPAPKEIQLKIADTEISAWDAGGAGVFAAPVAGNKVFLAAAQDREKLAALLDKVFAGTPASTASLKVPMWLDRWDRYALNFYYLYPLRPNDENGRPVKFYDQAQDFEFLKKYGAGVALWDAISPWETAAGFTRKDEWEWALRAARKAGVSVSVNPDMGSSAVNIIAHPEWRSPYRDGYLGTSFGTLTFTDDGISWTSDEAQDGVLSVLQQTIRRYTADGDNIVSWQEPHGENRNSIGDLVLESGPSAEENFRKFLREKYGTPEKLGEAWGIEITDWEQAGIPDLTDFAGYSDEKIDLTGKWKIQINADENALTADDAGWPEILAPGHAIARWLPTAPAVFRRHVSLPVEWLKKHGEIWLYVFDFNDTRGGRDDAKKRLRVFVNGEEAEEEPVAPMVYHWTALPVKHLLRAGDNTVTLWLPRGILGYKTYLSPVAPRRYLTDFTPTENACWADLSEWRVWYREQGTRRGLQMIRRVDPNRPVIMMSPDANIDSMLKVAREYRGNFHNTGYMAGWWSDSLPALMRGAGLPISAEPSSSPDSPMSLAGSYGNWITEGVNGIHYFYHLGAVTWFPEIQKRFEEYASVFMSMGKYHAPRAEVAALYSGMMPTYYNFMWTESIFQEWRQRPWTFASGYLSPFNARKLISPTEILPTLPYFYDSDALAESSFTANSGADTERYRVVIDAGTSILDEPTVRGIERYVRNGGTFVLFGLTARHTPAKPNVWSLAELAGYSVMDDADRQPRTGTLTVADNKVFPSLPDAKWQGIRLEKKAPDAIDLLKWEDGTVAAGARRVGKGWFIHLGVWGESGLLGAYGNARGETADNLARLLDQLLRWRGITPTPAALKVTSPWNADKPRHQQAFWRHFVSNNGLYDIWCAYNRDKERTLKATFDLSAMPVVPKTAFEVLRGQATAINNGKFNVELAPLAVNMWLTPRPASDAAAEWFTLQRDWWRAGTDDLGKPFPDVTPKNALHLHDDWRLHVPADDGKIDPAVFAAPGFDAGAWEERPLGIFSIPDYPGAKRGIFRRQFAVPENWRDGRVSLWIRGRWGAFADKADIWLDGKLIRSNVTFLANDDMDGSLTPGKHVLTLDITGADARVGCFGEAWLDWHPSPVATTNLAGIWEASSDGLRYAPVPLPGEFSGLALRQTKVIDKKYANMTVVLNAKTGNGVLRGVIVNGIWVGRTHGFTSGEMNINITPLVKFGTDNEIIIINNGASRLTSVMLEFHPKGVYP